MKTCSKCGAQHPSTLEHFYSNGPGKLRPACKVCDRSRVRAHYLAQPEHVKAINRRAVVKYKYGITAEERDSLLASQDHKCAICERDLKGFAIGDAHVDHDHQTGCVRGVLCHICNKGIGFFKDDTEILQRVIDYLTREVATRR